MPTSPLPRTTGRHGAPTTSSPTCPSSVTSTPTSRPDPAPDQRRLRRLGDRRSARVAPGLDKAWHTHGYYGSASHNIKAIYQRYLGWYDGNPRTSGSTRPKRPPPATSRSSVASMPPSQGAGYADAGDFASPPSWRAMPCSPRRTTRPHGTSWRRCSSGSATVGERNLAQLLPHRRVRAAHRQGRAHGAHQCGTRPGPPPPSSSTRWRSGSTAEGVGRVALDQLVLTDEGSATHGAQQRVLIHYPSDLEHTADLTVTLTRPQLMRS